MKKLAPKVFVYASVVFGVFGVLMVLTLPARGDGTNSELNQLLSRLLFITGFVVLSSFALSVATKYLDQK